MHCKLSYISSPQIGGVPIQTTTDYSPFGVSLDGRTIAYQPAPAPTPAVSVVYQHKFDDGPNAHPYTTLPSTLDAKLTNISWTNTQNKWTNFNGFTGKAIAIDSALADTTRLFLNLLVNSGYKLDVTSYSFYHRSSSTGYSNYKLYVNNKLVGIGTVFVTSSSSLQFTGNQNVLNAISGLTGNVTVRLDLFGGAHGAAATFRLDNFTLNGYTQLIATPNLLAKGYRYGFDGMEKDDEVKGNGNSYTAQFWQYDSRTLRRWNLDPIYNTDIGRYVVYANNPTYYVDPKGDFKTKFGAKLYNTLHGGNGEIFQASDRDENHAGEWFVGKKIEYKGKGVGIAYERKFGWGNGRKAQIANTIDDVANELHKGLDYAKKNASDAWNSPLARYYIPDYYTLSGSFQTSSGTYMNEELTFTLILRGRDPGLYFNTTTGFGGVSSVGVDIGCSVGKGYYLGDARNLSSRLLSGWQGSGSVGVGLKSIIGGSVNGGVDVGFSDGKATTVTDKVGISVGVGVSTPIFQGGGGAGMAKPAISIIKF